MSATRLCDEDCTAPAVGIYEGIVPPAGTIRYAACSRHAPDVQPIRYLREELPSRTERNFDGGSDE